MKTKTSKRRADTISNAAFLLGLAVIAITNQWWPGIMIVIGIKVALRHLLIGEYIDTLISLVVFGGVYVIVGYKLAWSVILPVIFITAAFYLLAKEWMVAKLDRQSRDIDLEELKNEVEEDHQDKK